MSDFPTETTLRQGRGADSDFLMLAIVFTDIVGSSGKCALVGDEAWIEILIHHFSRARKVLKRFRGFEIEIIGDAFMVGFHSVREALGFAAEIQRRTVMPR